MATLTINITGTLSDYLNIGDKAYIVDTTTSGGFTTETGGIIELGAISSIPSSSSFLINTYSGSDPGSSFDGHFAFFAKDNKVNTSGIIGSYAEVKFVNNSNSEAELFQITMNVEQSSK